MLLSLHLAPTSEPPWKKVVFTSRLIVRTGNHPKIHIYGMGWTNRDITSFDILPFTVRNIKGASQYMTWWLSLLWYIPFLTVVICESLQQKRRKPDGWASWTADLVLEQGRMLVAHLQGHILSPGIISPGIISPGILSPGIISPGIISPGGDMILFCQLVTMTMHRISLKISHQYHPCGTLYHCCCLVNFINFYIL